MNKLPEILTRKVVLNFISKSASYGNLGAFIGAGFSKAVLNDSDGGIALSWGDLLERVSLTLEIDYDSIEKEGYGYPEIATKICHLHSAAQGIDFAESLKILKFEIAKLTSWYPDKEQRARYSTHMDNLSLSWVITTNYDLVIESLMTGTSVTLGPDDSLISPKNIVPVFHLHGVRTSPEQIIISQEDYVGLFRPTEYRQIKLALMIKESTMLILGYGLGDVNVLTALDWSRNVFKSTEREYPNEIIQVLRTKSPKKRPYRDSNSIVIIETDDISNFLTEYAEIRVSAVAEEQKTLKDVIELSEHLNNPDVSTIEKFIDDLSFRKKVLNILSTFPNHLISGFVAFLDKCIDENWERAKPDGAFQAYADNLSMIIDILTNFDVNQMPPALFETAGYAMHRVGYYVGNSMGDSFPAKRIWDRRKNELSEELVKELTNFADQHGYQQIIKLCRQI
ncbi:TPA: SIR2 family protein [Klebsiella pneumoniae]